MGAEKVLVDLLGEIARAGYLETTMDDSRYFVIGSWRLELSYVEYELLRRLMESED